MQDLSDSDRNANILNFIRDLMQYSREHPETEAAGFSEPPPSYDELFGPRPPTSELWDIALRGNLEILQYLITRNTLTISLGSKNNGQ